MSQGPRGRRPAARPRARTLWEEGRQPGHEVVTLAAALMMSAVTLDLWLGSGLTLFFDLCFVAVCVAAALAVRPSDFFTVGVLPPLLMVTLCLLLALSDTAVLARPEDSVVQAVVTGLAHHSVALLVGHLACLAALVVRQRVSRRPDRLGGSDPAIGADSLSSDAVVPAAPGRAG